MVNNIIDGISIKLNQVFGDGTRIYSETVKQGLEEPCFFIAVLNPSQAKMIKGRYFRQHPFDVHYFPTNTDGKNKEIQSVASQLLDGLEYITLTNGDLVRGTNMNYEVVDGVLHFFVQYNMYIKKIEVSDDMETLTIETDVEG